MLFFFFYPLCPLCPYVLLWSVMHVRPYAGVSHAVLYQVFSEAWQNRCTLWRNWGVLLRSARQVAYPIQSSVVRPAVARGGPSLRSCYDCWWQKSLRPEPAQQVEWPVMQLFRPTNNCHMYPIFLACKIIFCDISVFSCILFKRFVYLWLCSLRILHYIAIFYSGL